MAFNKIQPEQIQMPTFFSDSGDLNISQVSDTGVQINVSRGLTGDFSVTGQLLINNSEAFGMPNNIDGNKFDIASGNLMFAGNNTEIGGDSFNKDNLALYSINSDISGVRNVIVRGTNATFNTGSRDNVVLAGNQISFAKQATGCVAIKDSLSTTSLSIVDDNTLHMQFDSGSFIGPDLHVTRRLSVEDSGIISGNLSVMGESFFTGNIEFAGENVVRGTTRFETGFAIPLWSGNNSIAGSVNAPATGALAISGSTLLVYVGASQWGGVAISGGTP